MRILNCCTYDGNAGTERAFVDYTHVMLAGGHSVTALVHPKAPFAWEVALPGVEVVQTEINGEYQVTDLDHLARLIRLAAPDLVITHCPEIVPELKAGAGGLAPVVCVFHFDSQFSAVDDTLLSADVIVTVNDATRREIIAGGWPAPRAFHIPNMVDASRELAPRARPRHDPPVVGTLARLSPEKGSDVLVEAVRLLRERGIRCRALIGGDGDECEPLFDQIQQAGLGDDVELCGWVDDKDAFYRGLDLYCLPSRCEGFGIVLLEAAAHGLPIVATDCTGPREILSHGETGLLVPADDAPALADGLASMLADPEAAERMGREARARLVPRYERRAVGPRILELLDAAVAGFKGQGAAAR